jgi:hypothetical protein
MLYERMDLENGEILTAEHLAYLEDGIATRPNIYYFEMSNKEGHLESNILRDSLNKQYISKYEFFNRVKTGICLLLVDGIPYSYIGYSRSDKVANFGLEFECIFEEDLSTPEPQ